MRFSLGYHFVFLLLALALVNQAFAAVYRPSFRSGRYDSSDSDSDSDDETCDDSGHEVQCRLKAADDPACYLELVPNQGWIRRSCADGTLFSERNCGCTISLAQEDDSDSSSDEDCDEPRRDVRCTRKPTHDRSSYLQFIEEKGWKRQSCPEGTAYSADDCACSIFLSEYHSNDDSSSSSSSSEEDNWGQAVANVCTREQVDDSRSYLQMVQGHGWMKRVCAKGTVYDAQTCRCSMMDSEDDSSDSSCEDDDSTYDEWDGRCLLKAASSQNSFRQFAQGHGWMTRPCPKGTGFSAEDCGCTVSACSDDDDSSSSEEDSWSHQSYGNGQNARSGYGDSSSSSEEDDHSWSHHSYGKGPRISAGYGDSSSSEEDESSWSTTTYFHGAAPCTSKPTHDRRSYLQFVEGKGWKRQPCPKGTAYSANNCACSITLAHEHSDDSSSSSSEEDDHSWSQSSYGKGPSARSGYGDSSSSEEDDHSWSHRSYGKGPKISAGYGGSNSENDGSSWNTPTYGHGDDSCTRKPTHDRSSYLQFVEGKGWKRQPCPRGTAFSADDCACSITVAHGGDNDDSSSSSSEEDSNSWSQQTYGRSRTASSGYGGSSRVFFGNKRVSQTDRDSSSSSEEDDNSWRSASYNNGRASRHSGSSYGGFRRVSRGRDAYGRH